MRGKFTLVLLALTMISCSKDWTRNDQNLDYHYGRKIPHGKIVLGDRLENPYKTENITKALASLYPTKAGRVEVDPTDLYVRFLPSNDEEFEEAIGEVWEHIQKFNPEIYGYEWAPESAPRFQLAPMGYRGYIEARPIRKK